MSMLWPLGKRTQEGWMAGSLAEGRARFAHVRPGERPAVLSLEEREWDGMDTRTLERVTKQVHTRRYRCTTVLAQSDYHMLLVEAPNVKRDELKAAVRQIDRFAGITEANERIDSSILRPYQCVSRPAPARERQQRSLHTVDLHRLVGAKEAWHGHA